MPRALILIAWLVSILAGCASLPSKDPLNVTLVGVDSLPGEGMEARMAVKLRVQNPNDTPVDFDGVAVNLAVRGMDFASGVSDEHGSVPRFGESVLVIPVSVSAWAMLKQVYSFATGDRTKVDFVARGKLSGTGLIDTRFESKGEFELPNSVSGMPLPGTN